MQAQPRRRHRLTLRRTHHHNEQHRRSPNHRRTRHAGLAPVGVDHDRSRNAEVERLKGVGATVYEDHRKPDGTGWVTMADPVGNLLCVERSAGERV
jgi:hypothetical protein